MKTVNDAMYYIKNTAFLGGPDTDKDLTEAVRILEKELEAFEKVKCAFAQYIENDLDAAGTDYCLEVMEQVGCDKEMRGLLGLGYFDEKEA